MKFFVVYLARDKMHHKVFGEFYLQGVYDILNLHDDYNELCKKIEFGEEPTEEEFAASDVYLIPYTVDTKYVILDLKRPKRSYTSEKLSYRSVLEDTLVKFKSAIPSVRLMTYSDREIEDMISDAAKIISL